MARAKPQPIIDDEILFTKVDESEENGVWKTTRKISFGDGSILTMTAQVKLPPRIEMTPQPCTHIDVQTGVEEQGMDGGVGEMMDLIGQASAFRVLRLGISFLESLPTHPNSCCVDCVGETVCSMCSGKGCSECKFTGKCPICNGRGFLLFDTWDEAE